MRDLYSVLRVAQKADDIEIKASFRKLVKAYHPDLKPDDMHAQQSFREIVQAYECLSDRAARRRYDAFLADKRAKARQRFKRLMVTMSVAFLLTTSSIVLVAIELVRDRATGTVGTWHLPGKNLSK
jgi:DnaJ-class molecular chaperone